jgi:hypothetical protein
VQTDSFVQEAFLFLGGMGTAENVGKSASCLFSTAYAYIGNRSKPFLGRLNALSIYRVKLASEHQFSPQVGSVFANA